jgi:hypothetical protein
MMIAVLPADPWPKHQAASSFIIEVDCLNPATRRSTRWASAINGKPIC